MKDQQLTSSPPSHWSTHWDEGEEEEGEEDEPELPVDYAFLGGIPSYNKYNNFKFNN